MRPQREFGNMRFLDHTHQGWNRAWDVIASAFGSMVCECPHTHEVWQYMGTVLSPNGWQHEFRHRNYQGQRKCVAIPALESDFALARKAN